MGQGATVEVHVEWQELRVNGVDYSRSGQVSLAARNGVPNTTMDGGSSWRTTTRDIRRRNAV